jgi:energy-converting hydrogenase A subunit O
VKRTVDVSIPIGPVHPCWKEPTRVKCETKGEYVVRAEVELGYMKKGIEAIMKGRPWQEVMFLAERVCGICSVIHNMVFIEALEKMSSIPVPERAALLRVVVNELDRMQSHLLANFSYCYTIEHETLAMYLLDVRERVLDNLERITGSRVMAAYMVPGGIRFDLRDEDEQQLLAGLNVIQTNVTRYMHMFEHGPLIALRSKGIGVLTRDAAREAHAVGPTARASGMPETDRRLQHPTYQKLGFNPVSRGEGDNYARIMVRFQELLESIGIIQTALDRIEPGPVRGGGIPGSGEIAYSGEAPRGELTYFLKTDVAGRVEEVSIQTPSIMNIEACCHSMLKGVASLADVPSTFVSADPCIACTER